MNSLDLKKCFHCHLSVPFGEDYSVITHEGNNLPMCCAGCKAVTETILALGLSQFYQYRDKFPDKPIDLVPLELSAYTQFNNPDIYREYVETEDAHEDIQSITLYIEGVTCAACVWLVEHRLRQLEGIQSCVINLNNRIAQVAWNKQTLKLSDIFIEITKLGYKVHLSHVADIEKHHKKESDSALKRIGVAGLGAMQVMMIAVGLYAGGMQGIEPQYNIFLKWISLIVTVPVFIYVGNPFIKSAIRSLRNKQLGMDVPIALAFVAIMTQSTLTTLIGRGEIYFDSVCMFLFFLTLGRYLEMRVRHKASDTIVRMMKLLPTTVMAVNLVDGNINDKRLVPISSVEKGDTLLVKRNSNFPADGILLHGQTHVNEAMLTGEFMPKTKKIGSYLYAGTKNIMQDALMKVTKTGNSTRLLSISQLLSKAQSERPDVISMVNKTAAWFVAFVLVAAFGAGLAWYFIDKTQAFWIMLSVLVISCPCALSLATPIALTISMNKLSERGFLVMKNRLIEGFSKITHCVFDKTGTLTKGELSLDKITLLSCLDENEVLAIAGSLEEVSEHPIALSIREMKNRRQICSKPVISPDYQINRGVEGIVDNKTYRIGKIIYAQTLYNKTHEIHIDPPQSLVVLLSSNEGPLALFYLTDKVRPDAKSTVQWLKSQHITPVMLTGDASSSAENIAHELGIDTFYKNKTPAQKLQIIKELSDNNNRVLVVGDGSNDVLAMAGAYLSISMGAGTDLAKTHSDAVLMNNNISLLKDVFNYSIRARAVIKQNITWAISYNLIALPVAACGWVVPYVAVIGMSLSSLLVTFNALRLKRFDRHKKNRNNHENPIDLLSGSSL